MRSNSQRFSIGLEVVTFLFVFFWFFVSAAYAQGLAVKVQPTTIEERVDPGAVVEGSLTVTNESGDEQTYHIGTRNVEGMEDSGRPVFSDGTEPEDALNPATWIKPQVKEVTLAEGESASIPYRIEVPLEASPGGYFAALFVTREADTVTESGAGVGFHVASLVNLTINGDVVEDLVFNEFATNKSLYTDSNVSMMLRIENTGTVHERPVGLVTIVDMLGNEVGQLTVNENAGAILPRSERMFTLEWHDDGFHVGRYTALASIVFGDRERRTITRELTFWLVPVKELAYVLGGIVLVLLVFVVGIRAYVRRVLRNAGHSTVSTKRAESQASFARKLLRTVLWFAALVVVGFGALIVFFA